MAHERDSGSVFTFLLLACGSSLLAGAFGWRAGLGVFAVVWALGGEIQRKVNQVLDELESKRD